LSSVIGDTKEKIVTSLSEFLKPKETYLSEATLLPPDTEFHSLDDTGAVSPPTVAGPISPIITAPVFTDSPTTVTTTTTTIPPQQFHTESDIPAIISRVAASTEPQITTTAPGETDVVENVPQSPQIPSLEQQEAELKSAAELKYPNVGPKKPRQARRLEKRTEEKERKSRKSQEDREEAERQRVIQAEIARRAKEDADHPRNETGKYRKKK
jgi:hypothetical protein